MFHRILVAFDGTPPSRSASRVAIEIGARFGSAITLATVYPESTGPTDGHLESLVPLDSEGRTLSRMIEELEAEGRKRGIPSVKTAILQGEVVPSLLGYLKGHPQDLVITGSRMLSRGRRLLLGSVSSALVGEAPCPVLVVRPDSAPAPTPPKRAPSTGRASGSDAARKSREDL